MRPVRGRTLVRSIGGLVVEVRSSDLAIADAGEAAYRPFAASATRASAPDIAVEVATGRARRGADAIFTCGTWEMFPERADGYGLRFRTASRSHSFLARCDRPTRRVRLEMGPAAGPIDPVRYPLDQLLLMNHLAFRGGLLLHAAGLVLDGAGLAFPGASGAGKSTLTELLATEIPASSFLSDDRVIVRSADGGFDVHGTPWPGTARVASNASAPLGALLFLAKAPRHGLSRLAPAEALRRLLPVVSCPWYDRVRLPGVLDACGRLAGAVPCYELRFARDAGVAALIGGLAARRHA